MGIIVATGEARFTLARAQCSFIRVASLHFVRALVLTCRDCKPEPGMRVDLLLALGTLLALAGGTPASAAQVADPGPGGAIVDCRSAAQVFEQSAGLPPGLLLAIGQVESGRYDPVTRRVDPWPWAANHAGEGRYFASAPEAIAWVAAQQALGNRSIDVGCFQVNLQYHPDAFASLAEAFDPAANARYAADFLRRLHERSGNWQTAAALYHSADPVEGQWYGSRVVAAWTKGDRFLDFRLTDPPRPADPVVVRLAAGASVVRVVVPAWASVQAGQSQPAWRPGLPRVITPGRDAGRGGLSR
jgi:Transglycosylase SLT domain